VAQRGETLAQNVRHAKCLPDEPAQLLKNGASLVGLKIRLPAFNGAANDTGSNELFKFSLCRPGTEANQANNLSLIKSLFGVSEQKTQHRLTGGAEERRSYIIDVGND